LRQARLVQGAEAGTRIANMLYPGVDKLSEEQKQTVSALASISAGMAGGITTGNTAGHNGASAGKNAVENNFLSVSDKTEEIAKQKLNSKIRQNVKKRSKRLMICEKDIASDRK
jgi:filamentous hemagglutinin